MSGRILKWALSLACISGIGVDLVAQAPLFRERPVIDWQNEIVEDSCHTVLLSEYFYNGGGVAIADFNQDGWQDIYLVANFGPNALWLNRGNWTFEQLRNCGAEGKPGWDMGATVADVNNDGWPDIYVSYTAPLEPNQDRKNQLFINHEGKYFTEAAEKWGIAGDFNTTQAYFIDYDQDGDEDIFLLNRPEDMGHGLIRHFCIPARQSLTRPVETSDRLYRNDGNQFVDVTDAAGIRNHAWGLSANIVDLNSDGWPDIYVANDYNERDFLYINQQNGTFRDEILSRTSHISNFSMGSDAGDLNNDGLQDLFVVDMVSEYYQKSKTNMGAMDPSAFWHTVSEGNHHQYMMNCLQIQRRDGTFSEIAQMAGVDKTDWSWGALITDFDLDGWQDILVTNGIVHEIRDNDTRNRIKSLYQEKGSERIGLGPDQVLAMLPSDRPHNYAYRNKGQGWEFEDVSKGWGFDFEGWSNGMAIADLDNDGDPDVVMSNLNTPVKLYENQAMQQGDRRSVVVAGTQEYPLHQGLEIWLEYAEGKGNKAPRKWLSRQVRAERGFLSCSQREVLFGLPANAIPTRLVWRGRGKEMWVSKSIKAAQPFQKIELSEGNATSHLPWLKNPRQEWKAKEFGVGNHALKHTSTQINDYDFQVLLPYNLSETAPVLEVVDCDGNGFEDVLWSGGAGAIELWLQEKEGGWKSAPFPGAGADGKILTAATALDVDGDGQLDWLLGFGGNHWPSEDMHYSDELWLNVGGGKFERSPHGLPEMAWPTSVFSPIDFDHDGDLDLVVGYRHSPRNYPLSPPIQIWENRNGRFVDASQLLPADINRGMLTSALVEDWNGDGWEDLILAGEWMPITWLRNVEGKGFSLSSQGPVGLWYSAFAIERDAHGKRKYIFGNVGQNAKLHADSTHHPLLYGGDLDGNGVTDIVLAKDNHGVQLPIRGRQCSSQQMPQIVAKFPTYQAFAKADLPGIYGETALAQAPFQAKADRTDHVSAEWQDGNIVYTSLPNETQVSSLLTGLSIDLNGDKQLEWLGAGNFNAYEVETPRQDAGRGFVLEFPANGAPAAWPWASYSLPLGGDVRAIRLLHLADGSKLVLVARVGGDLMGFRP